MESIPTKKIELQKKISKDIETYLKSKNQIKEIPTNWSNKPAPRKPTMPRELF